MSGDEEMEAFLKERDEVLISGDVDRVMAFHAKWNPSRPPLRPAMAPIAMHQARTSILSLPMEVRVISKRWLLERGYQSWDDGDIPG